MMTAARVMMQLILKFKTWHQMLILMGNHLKPPKTILGNLSQTVFSNELIFPIIENQTMKNVGSKIKVPIGLMMIGMTALVVVSAIVSILTNIFSKVKHI